MSRQKFTQKLSGVQEQFKFAGFDPPSQNFSKLPHSFIDCLPMFDTKAELKVVIYLLRHTWGFSEFGKPKRFTTDEFMNGRKRADGSRMDAGTGLSNNSVITGLKKAVEHGFILVEVDDSDKARTEKCYCLNMSNSAVQDLHTNPQEVHSGARNLHSVQRKKPIERNSKKEKEAEEEAVRLFEVYENNIGSLTPLIANALTEATRDHPLPWIFDAIDEAVKHNARRLNYILAILDRWKREGKDEGKGPSRKSRVRVGEDRSKYKRMINEYDLDR